jgi:hypothetical protein
MLKKKPMQVKEELLDIEGIQKSNKPLIDLFIRRTAVLTSTPESMVEKIVKDQWRSANRLTQSGQTVAEIDFANLGTFFISPTKAKKRIKRHEKFLTETLSKDPFTDEKNEKKRQRSINESVEAITSIKSKLKQIQ